MKHGFRWLGSMLLLLSVCLCCSISAHAAGDAAQAMLKQVRIEPVMDTGTFSVNGETFQRLLIPQEIVTQFETSEYAVYPGERDDLVRQWKLFLYDDKNFSGNEYVTYSQVRPPNTKDDIDSDYWIEGDDYEDVLYYFDDHLKTLLETIYLFCGLEEKEACLDELTCHILRQLPQVSLAMRQDIERVYKARLTATDTQGTIARNGLNDGLYYFAQTDPDWANMIFEYNNNGDTIRDRGCGCACAAMIVSTYWKVEVTPRWTRNIALTGDWPVDYGLPNDYFKDVASQYAYYGRYQTSLVAPNILPKSKVDMNKLAEQIGENGYMAIIHVVKGAFTSHEHYMVLADYEVIDGKGYFLVADPYELQSRYSDWDQMKKLDNGHEGLIYATPEVLYRDCKSVILFEKDRHEFPLFSKAEQPEYLP